MSNPAPTISTQVAVSPSVSLHTRKWSGAGRVPFLLVHGLASNARMWDGVGDILAHAGHETVAVDLRGHGESTQVDQGFGWDTLTNDLVAVVDAMSWEHVIAVGQSWGGNVVLEFAAREPDRVAGLALIDGGFLRLSDDFASWEEVERILAPPKLNGFTLKAMEERMRAQDDGFPENSIVGRLANFEAGADGGLRNRLRLDNHLRILRHLWKHDPDEVGADLGSPVEVVAVPGGPPSKLKRVGAFAAATGATVHWRNGHHDIHTQQPDVVAQILLGLAERVET